MSFATHKMHTIQKATNCAIKNMAAVVALRSYCWLRLAGISNDLRSWIEDLPFGGKSLFNDKGNSMMDNLYKKGAQQFVGF